jgi:DNA repair exonuclease SbcCD ATPase subunit
MLSEMKSLNEQMKADREAIERLKVEYAVLKAETQRLKTESHAALSRLEAIFAIR